MTRVRSPLLLYLVLAVGAEAAEIAFVNVNVVPMTSDTVLAGQTVIVRDGRVSAVGDVDRTVLPEQATIIDGTNRYLIPGLAEMHAHVPGRDSEDLERVLTLFVANGVTSMRGMLGRPGHLELRDELESGAVLGPRLVTAGPSFNGNSVSSPREAANMARAQHAAGYDFLKIHPGLTRAEFTAVAETANALDIRFAGHVPADVGLPMALELGISTIDHLDGYMQMLIPAHEDPTGGYGGFFGVALARFANPEKIAALVEQTRSAGTWNVPTQSLFEHVVGSGTPAAMQNRPEMKYMPAATVERWAAAKTEILEAADVDSEVAARAVALRRRLIRELHAGGAGLLLGSDAPQIFNVPGFSLHRELEYLVRAGLTPYEALRTGTANAARWFGRGNELGTIAIGRLADLVLLDDDPLADIANTRRIHGVMLRGRWLGRPELDELLARYARRP